MLTMSALPTPSPGPRASSNMCLPSDVLCAHYCGCINAEDSARPGCEQLKSQLLPPPCSALPCAVLRVSPFHFSFLTPTRTQSCCGKNRRSVCNVVDVPVCQNRVLVLKHTAENVYNWLVDSFIKLFQDERMIPPLLCCQCTIACLVFYTAVSQQNSLPVKITPQCVNPLQTLLPEMHMVCRLLAALSTMYDTVKYTWLRVLESEKKPASSPAPRTPLFPVPRALPMTEV
ncbi:hypothetical protein NQZ68_026568 [Dissostichus eleginoides]|nr:hypothetical protein NQZ68_026568 [Dissostichus eleginoides]